MGPGSALRSFRDDEKITSADTPAGPSPRGMKTKRGAREAGSRTGIESVSVLGGLAKASRAGCFDQLSGPSLGTPAFCPTCRTVGRGPVRCRFSGRQRQQWGLHPEPFGASILQALPGQGRFRPCRTTSRSFMVRIVSPAHSRHPPHPQGLQTAAARLSAGNEERRV